VTPSRFGLLLVGKSDWGGGGGGGARGDMSGANGGLMRVMTSDVELGLGAIGGGGGERLRV
jgi:hypothetical protein